MDFVGLTVTCTLQSPPNAHVQGTVVAIADQQLTLSDVSWLDSGRRTATFQIPSSNIADLEVVPEATPDPPSAQDGSIAASGQPSDPGGEALVDPAIVSFSKPAARVPPVGSTEAPDASRQPPVPSQVLEDAARGSPGGTAQTMLGGSTDSTISVKATPAAAILTEPFDNLSLGHDGKSGRGPPAVELSTDGGRGPGEGPWDGPEERATSPEKLGRRRGRRGTKPKASENGTLPAPVAAAAVPPPKGPGPSSTDAHFPVPGSRFVGRGLQAFRKPNHQPKAGAGSRREKARLREVQNGWATEDATDIQELGDFDFAGNLSKFNKSEVFRRLREEDTTADEARLVSHNRLPRAGTAGGRNLHWTENVMGSPKPGGGLGGKWTSEAGESEDEASDALTSERSSKRNRSGASLRRAPAPRKGSERTTAADPSGSRMRPGSFGTCPSPFENAGGSPASRRSLSTSPYIGSATSSKALLRVKGSGAACPCLTPLQMLELEQHATTELGLTEDVLTENAARGIAEAAHRVAVGSHGPGPSRNALVLILAGNHKTGARALAAGRHLRNHGYRVVATVVGLDRREELLELVKKQANAFRKAAGELLRPAEFLEQRRAEASTPSATIEALFGIHTCFEDLRKSEQAWFFEMIVLRDAYKGRLLAVDVPAGLDASSAEVTTVDGRAMSPGFHAVVFLAAPKPWALAEAQEAAGTDADPPPPPPPPRRYLVDIGISNLAWRRLGNRRGKGIDWGNQWLVELG